MSLSIFKAVFFNRNILLILAIFAGFTFGEYSYLTKDYILTLLIVVMVFSSSGIPTSSMFPIKKVLKPMGKGVLLNFIVFGAVLLPLAYFLMPTEMLFYGFVVIAATPPGVVIIPFSMKSKGDINYASMGVLGGFMASIVLTPLIIAVFTTGATIEPLAIVFLMLKLVLLPLLLSRVLLIPQVKKYNDKVKGRIIDYIFAIIIFTAVGMNKDVIASNLEILIYPSIVLFISLFVLGGVYYYLNSAKKDKLEIVTSETLLLTVKSSGFTIVTALELFGTTATIPAAVLSIFVLLFLIAFSIFKNLKVKETLSVARN